MRSYAVCIFHGARRLEEGIRGIPINRILEKQSLKEIENMIYTKFIPFLQISFGFLRWGFTLTFRKKCIGNIDVNVHNFLFSSSYVPTLHRFWSSVVRIPCFWVCSNFSVRVHDYTESKPEYQSVLIKYTLMKTFFYVATSKNFLKR
jgi:hypothetical protein